MADTTPGTGSAGPAPAPRPAVPGTFLGIHPQDLVLMACGLMAAIGSAGSFYTISVDGTVVSTTDAWHGFFGWFGVVLALVGSGLLAARLLGLAQGPGVRQAVLAAFALALASTLAALAVIPGDSCGDVALLEGFCDVVDFGHGSGYWRTLGAVAAGLLLAFLRRRAD